MNKPTAAIAEKAVSGIYPGGLRAEG